MRVSVWAGFGACVAFAACGGSGVASRGSGESDGGGAVDASSRDGSGSSSSGSGSSSGSSGDGASVDAPFSCPPQVPPPMTGNAACNQCVSSLCGETWCACAGDSSAGDAGSPMGCIGYVDCVIVCVDGNPDAGIPPAKGGFDQCSNQCGPTYGAQAGHEGDALINCLIAECSTSATCNQ